MAGLTPYNTLTNTSTTVKLQFLGYLRSGVTPAVYYNEPIIYDVDNPGYVKSLRSIANAQQQHSYPIIGVAQKFDFRSAAAVSQTAGATPRPWGNQEVTEGGKPGEVWGYMDPYLTYSVPGLTDVADFYPKLYGQTYLVFDDNNPADKMGYSTAQLNLANATAGDQNLGVANGQFKIISYLSSTGSTIAQKGSNWLVCITQNVFNTLPQTSRF